MFWFVRVFEKDVEVTRREPEHKPCSIYEMIRVEDGSSEDYSKLCWFHYRSVGDHKSGLRGKAVFRLMIGDSLIGVIVYSYSYLNLKPRNMVFGERCVYTSGDLHKARLINEEIARISRVIIHPKFRGIGLDELLVKETLSKSGVRVVEALAVMAKYNPFFEKAGMAKVGYTRAERAIDTKIKGFLNEHDFNFSFSKSGAYCREFFSKLTDEDREVLVNYLSEFSQQPFVKVKRVTPDLISKVFSSDGAYSYWVNPLKV